MKSRWLLVGILLFCACAARPKVERPKLPPGSREPPVTAPEEEPSAERLASHALLDEGRGALERGLFDRSADLFQEAVTVDPSNGEGYYYLALVKARTGEYGEAEGLLEKAESLLRNDPDWTDRLEELKRELFRNRPD